MNKLNYESMVNRLAQSYVDYVANDNGVYSTSHLHLISITKGLSDDTKDDIFNAISAIYENQNEVKQ